jgi:hypothetical protein
MKNEFDKRKVEISAYFEILHGIDSDSPKLIYTNEKGEIQEILFDSRKINIFRASAFLLLYNLVESTVFNAVISIFDDINSEKHIPKLKYFDVIDDIKKYWLDNIYKHDERIKKESVIKSYLDISNKIFNESLVLASNYIKYGGSLDALKIKETIKALGLNSDSLHNNYKKETHGEALKQIQEKRNWLAHGEKTFAEIGQDYTAKQLEEWQNYIIEHLENFINLVDNYLINQEYKQKITA